MRRGVYHTEIIIKGPLQKITKGKFHLILIYLSGKDSIHIEEEINKGRSLPHERLCASRRNRKLSRPLFIDPYRLIALDS